MQGQRSTMDSVPEAFEFDHGSSSSNTGVDRQHIWNEVLNHPFESRLLLSPADTHVTFPHAVSRDGRSLNSWNMGEPSSGRSSSLTTNQGAEPRLEERRFEPTNTLSLGSVNINLSNNRVANGPLFLQNTGSGDIPQNANLNAGYAGNHGGQVNEAGVSPQRYRPSESESGSASGSNNPSGSAGYFTDESDGRPGYSLDGRRLSCKRKAIEGVSAQSSSGASSSYSQQPENNVWSAAPRYNASGNLTISSPTENPLGVNPQEQLNPRLGAGMRSLAPDSNPALRVDGNVESSQRNFRMRINPSYQQDSAPSNFSLAGNAVRHSNVWPSHQLPSRFVPFNQSVDSRPTAANNSTPQIQPNAMNSPGLMRNTHLNPWNGTSDSRVGSTSSSPVIPAERPSLLDEINSRNMQINGSDLPIFVRAETRNWVQDPTSWSLANGGMSNPGDIASSSRVGSSSAVHPSPAPTWVSQPNPPNQNQQRLPDGILRSLVGSEPGGLSRNFPPLRPGAASSHEVAFSSGAGRQGHHQPHPRAAFWMDRMGDGPVGAPPPFRASPAANEGRSRIISEIRNALDIMRRGGEPFMFEDLLVLDQNLINGVAELQDRHRDMRLDVDNMSYEELLALEERIGNVNTGLKEETVMKFLKQRKYSSATMGAPAEVEPCCICQEEYEEAEDLGALDCGHIFHTGCIRQWLMQKNLCPVCKTTALVT